MSRRNYILSLLLLFGFTFALIVKTGTKITKPKVQLRTQFIQGQEIDTDESDDSFTKRKFRKKAISEYTLLILPSKRIREFEFNDYIYPATVHYHFNSCHSVLLNRGPPQSYILHKA